MVMWLVVLAVYVPLSLIGIGWGLPGDWVNSYLFDDHPVWTGQQIIALLPPSSSAPIGADVDPNPVGRSYPASLNDSDSRRAEIIARYRLYSAQPDEMITLRSLRQMKPGGGDFDPRLYQYGGVWIYGSAVCLALAHFIGFVDLHQSLAWYLDHPDTFGRFYLPLRLISVLGGLLLLIWINQFLGRQLLALRWRALVLLGLATMPGLIVFNHEAKPHVLGVALAWASFSLMRQSRRGALLAGVLAGLATGTVVSMVVVPVGVAVAFAVAREWKLALISILAAACAYFLTNPYVAFHILTDPSTLSGQLGNSTAMYGLALSTSSLWNALTLAYFTGPVVGLAVVILIFRPAALRLPMAWRAPFVSATLMLAVFVLLAAAKPAEYARFSLLPVTVLVAWSVDAASRIKPRWARWLIAGLPLVATVPIQLGATTYFTLAHWLESGPGASRRVAAAECRDALPAVLNLSAEPAPYSLPPIDLFRSTIVLNPAATDGRLTIFDDARLPMLSWAHRNWSLEGKPLIHFIEGNPRR